jgi:putative methyltransferase (TIGR04325 family)
MSIRNAAIKAVDPLLPRRLRGALQRRRFFGTHGWQNLHWGVFDSFESANDYAARHGHPPRFDMDQRKWLADRLSLLPHDYPVMFWMDRLFGSPEGRQFTRLTDLGGSVGVSYLAYKPYLHLPDALVWQVCELPEVAQFGRQVARERGEEARLAFCTDMLPAMEGADVLFTAGTIQYIDSGLEQMLGSLAKAPGHVFINRLPLSAGAAFVTLQNSGVAVHPYRVRNDAEFVQAMASLGYRVVDRWQCVQNSTHVPFHPECTLEHFHGFYLRRDGSP